MQPSEGLKICLRRQNKAKTGSAPDYRCNLPENHNVEILGDGTKVLAFLGYVPGNSTPASTVYFNKLEDYFSSYRLYLEGQGTIRKVEVQQPPVAAAAPTRNPPEADTGGDE